MKYILTYSYSFYLLHCWNKSLAFLNSFKEEKSILNFQGNVMWFYWSSHWDISIKQFGIKFWQHKEQLELATYVKRNNKMDIRGFVPVVKMYLF